MSDDNPKKSAIPDEDRQRAARISRLTIRLERLEALLPFAEGRRIEIQVPNVPAAHAVYLHGDEGVRLLAYLIDETSGELQALL